MRRAEELLDMMFEDHLKYRENLGRLAVESTEHEQIRTWLRSELSVAARAVRIPVGHPVGARRCWLGEQESGLVFYRVTDAHATHVASLYVMHAPDADFTHMRPLIHAGDKRVCRRDKLGLSAGIWNERGLTYAFISELDDDDLSDALANA